MKKVILIIFVAVLGLVAFLYLGKLFSPGVYVDAETYELSIDESALDSLIHDFKETNPQYKIPDKVGLTDGRENYKDYYYNVYFYYPSENQIIKTWTRSTEKKTTNFAFVAINDGLVLGKWRGINRNFDYSENKRQKRIFEERILDKIKEKIKH